MLLLVLLLRPLLLRLLPLLLILLLLKVQRLLLRPRSMSGLLLPPVAICPLHCRSLRPSHWLFALLLLPLTPLRVLSPLILPLLLLLLPVAICPLRPLWSTDRPSQSVPSTAALSVPLTATLLCCCCLCRRCEACLH